jgi:hypothetical protein
MNSFDEYLYFITVYKVSARTMAGPEHLMNFMLLVLAL